MVAVIECFTATIDVNEEGTPLTENEFTQASRDFHANTPLDKRKSLGQYMTPATVSRYLADQLDIQPGERVLDPAVGTGELLLAVIDRQPEATYEGWDIDEDVLVYARKNLTDDQAVLRCRSTLDVQEPGTWDVIIANPPYFEIKATPEQKARYASVIGGRPNIFALFFHQALDLLAPGGRLGFIVPPSMNNGAFFANLRRHIVREGAVKHVKVFKKSDMFHSAQTSVQVIIVEKRAAEHVAPAALGPHIFELSGGQFFVNDAEQLRQFWVGKESLHALGYRAITGTVVWNKYKDTLLPVERLDDDDVTPLIYASDIKTDAEGNTSIVWADKHNHRRGVPEGMASKGQTEEGIVVNRITGGLGSQSLRAAYVDTPFYGENHVNVVLPRPGVAQKVSWDELLRRIRGVNMEYISEFTGNTQISATELEHYLPL